MILSVIKLLALRIAFHLRDELVSFSDMLNITLYVFVNDQMGIRCMWACDFEMTLHACLFGFHSEQAQAPIFGRSLV